MNLLEQDKRHHLHPMTNPVLLQEKGPDIVIRGEGLYLYLSDGRRVIDALSGLCNVNIGYGNQRVAKAAFEAMEQLSYCHTMIGRSNPWAVALSAKLAEISPQQFQSFFFASSGSEANESAVKIALHYWRLRGQPEKRAVIARRGAYHGATLFAASLTGQDLYKTQFGLPISEMVHHADSLNWYLEGKGRSEEEFCRDLIRALEQQIQQIGPEKIAAFLGEAVQTGVVIPPANYWRQVRELCNRYDILLISDEVVTGFGKTGRMFGFETFGYEPDLFSMAKGLSSGYFPISAVGLGSKVAGVLQQDNNLFAHVFTNSGHPVGAAVALANIAVIEEEGLVDRVREEIGPYFRQQLNDLLEFSCVSSVRSTGVLGAFAVDASRGAGSASKSENDALLDKIVATAWKKGVIIRGGTMCLPMTITKQQVDETMRIVRASIVEASA